MFELPLPLPAFMSPVPICIPIILIRIDAEVDRSYVGGLERRKENPTVDVLDRLAKTLEVPLLEFFKRPLGGSPPPRPLRSGRRPKR